ncbi:hypothetical protein C8R47DRAFT_1091403, partial [Mycena vitilis]
MSPTSTPELVIQIFDHLSLPGLISASHVDSQWRALAPKIDSSIRRRLFALAFTPVAECLHPISLSIRICYVDTVEAKYNVRIPEPYRTILTEWPSSGPPPGMHWPHAVRFHASGFCYCRPQTGECYCDSFRRDVYQVSISMPGGTYRAVVDEDRVPGPDDDSSHELFDNPVRLHTAEQNAQTTRFIRAQPASAFQWDSDWTAATFTALELSRYYFHEDGWTSDGMFVMILTGPTRGQIHGWSSNGSSWYDGFEAESFWEWNYVEWDPAAPEADSNALYAADPQASETEDSGSDI